jgi:hypothetical protein
MYSKETLEKMISDILESIEFDDMSLHDYYEAAKLYKKLKEDLRKLNERTKI